jgi:hypothetical protein
MAKRSHPTIILVVLLSLAGAAALLGSNRHRNRQQRSAEPGAFDYYLTRFRGRRNFVIAIRRNRSVCPGDLDLCCMGCGRNM